MTVTELNIDNSGILLSYTKYKTQKLMPATNVWGNRLVIVSAHIRRWDSLGGRNIIQIRNVTMRIAQVKRGELKVKQQQRNEAHFDG